MIHNWIENRYLLLRIGRDGAVLKSARGKERSSQRRPWLRTLPPLFFCEQKIQVVLIP
jgi:hypothetical protein